MPTDLQQLQTIKTNVLAALVEISANPQPTYSVDGQSVSLESYQNMLFTQLKNLNELIGMENPFEFTSTALAR